MTLHKCTPAEVALIDWLKAEQLWHWRQVEIRRRGERAAKEADLRDKAQRAFDVVRDAHLELVQSAVGLRRRLLEMHAPEWHGSGAYLGRADLVCALCRESGYDEDYAEDFPCEHYTLARDWKEC